MIDRKALKINARAALREARPHPAWITLAVTGITLVLQLLNMSLNGDLEAYRTMYTSAANGDFTLITATGSTSFLGSLLAFALELMLMVVSVGYLLYCMRVSRRQKASVGDVFDAFGMFLRVVVLSFVKNLVLSLWLFLYAVPASVLLAPSLMAAAGMPVPALPFDIAPEVALVVCLPLLIPFVIAAYNYSLAEFILLDNPTFPALQCLGLSRMAMQGYKWERFKLDLSFIGWFLLSLIPFVTLWVQPYVTVTRVGFYEEIMPGFMEKLRTVPARAMPRNTDYHIPGEPTAPPPSDPPEDGQEDEKE